MSFGVGQSMHRSIKANLKLKGKRITYLDRKVEKINKVPLTFSNKKKFSHIELVAFKAKLKKEKEQLFVKRIALTIVLFIVLIIAIKLLDII